MKQKHYTIKDLERDFPNDDACLEWLKNNRWPDGIYCEKCQRVTKHHKITRRSAYACDFCGSHIYPMAGTILEHSATPLLLWFHAMFLMASTRCGISAKQLQRELGVTYKTAWRMFKKIRSMLDEDVMLLLRQVEVDETYIRKVSGRIVGSLFQPKQYPTPFSLPNTRRGTDCKSDPNVGSL